MNLSDLLKIGGDQDAGHEFDIVDPVRGDATGMKITMAGPDSERARKARFEMERRINELQARRGGMTPEQREEVAIGYLFAVSLSWHVADADKPLPLTLENFTRLCRAGTWLRAQLDGFAGDRSPYFGEAA